MDAKRKEEIEKAWVLPDQEEDKLKTIAKDIYNGKIFCDRHLRNPHDISLCFMTLMLMGPQPPKEPEYPEQDVKDKQDARANAMYDVLQRDADQKKYEEELNVYFPYEEKCYKENFLSNIGLVYEYLESQGPRSINGNPCFFSARLLNKSDTEKMFGFYEKYKAIREQADTF